MVYDYYVELKGRFRTRDEAEKYIHIRNTLVNRGERFIIVFFKRNVYMPGAKKRKDGSKRTQEEWAKDNKIEYLFYDELEGWLDVLKDLYGD